LAILPLPTLLHEFDTLEALHHGAFASGTTFASEGVVFGHERNFGLRRRTLGAVRTFGKDEVFPFLAAELGAQCRTRQLFGHDRAKEEIRHRLAARPQVG
jgi:hypothetical protein